MQINPEIQRNIWLQFSLQRLLMMPVVQVLIFYIVYQTGDGHSYNEPMMSVAETMFFVIVKVWGGYNAANSVIEEVNDHTWDFQKLSAMSPWQLTVGKLFGSTLYAWYGAIIPLAVMVYLLPDSQISGNPIWFIADMLLNGLSVQAAALFTSLLFSRTDSGQRKKLRPLPYLFIGLIIGNGIFTEVMHHNIGAHSLPPLNWFGNDFDFLKFQITTAALMLVWIVAGIYWQMRGQMKMKTRPWLWVGYVLFWGVYALGFHVNQLSSLRQSSPFQAFSRPDLMAFLGVLTNLYLVTFVESWNGVRYRRMLEAWKRRDYAKIFEICPRWIVTFVIALGFATLPAIYLGLDVLPLLVFLPFAIRDIALLHFFRLSPNNQRPATAAVFYLIVMYVLLPLLLVACKQKAVILDFEPLAALMSSVNLSSKTPGSVMVSGMLQALAMGALVAYRWNKYWVVLNEVKKVEAEQTA